MIPVTLKQIKILINIATVMTPAQKAQKTLLSKFGAYIRTAARRSIRNAKSYGDRSRPGEAPKGHSAPIKFKDTIFFYVDTANVDVTIGGVFLNTTRSGGLTVPGILEHGGMSFITQRINGQQQRKPVYVRARPHMKPAFDKAVKAFLPRLIENGITREV